MSFTKLSNSRTSLLFAILIAFAWFFFWFWQWQIYFQAFIWLRLGFGLILFIMPGACAYAILREKPGFTISHITFGFVISHLLFAMLGTLGRVLHLSFEMIKIPMAAAGLFLVLRFLIPRIREGVRLDFRPLKIDHILPLLSLLLVSGFACLVVIQRVLGDDDLTYLAYLTNWQNSMHLDFRDILFGEPKFVHPRFWIMSAPFAQALLADISKVPGIFVLGGYYEPFLVILAVLSWYELARTLTLSPRAASASSIMQLVFLLLLSEYLHPGAPFFKQLSADKATAAFIMAPVFFQCLFQFLKEPTKDNQTMFLLSGLSLTFMHPVILAYSVFIGGVLVLFNWKSGAMLQKISAIAILLAILIPQVALRFINTPGQVEIPYTSQDVQGQGGIEDMVKRWGDTQYYGFHPDILDMKIPYEDDLPFPQAVMTQGWLVFPILAAILALKQMNGNLAAQLLLACFLLGALAWFPFTGWILGFFLSAWMLERAVWLFPFGLSLIYTLSALRDHVNAKRLFANIHLNIPSNWLLLAVTVFAIGVFSLYMRENALPDFDKFIAKSQRYQGLAIAGQELDRQIPVSAYVVGSQQLNDIVPGLSSRSKLIIFRYSNPSHMQYYSDAQREERISDVKGIFSKSFSPEDKMSLIEKYDIRFLFLQSFDLRLFEDFIASYPDRVKTIETDGVIILRIDE